KITCLICALGVLRVFGIGLPPGGGGPSINPLLESTRVVSGANSAGPGTGIIETLPIVLALGEPIESLVLAGPPRPFALATKSVFPSPLTRTADGHHPTGKCPSTWPALPFSEITPIALIPASATYRNLKSGLSASATGCIPFRRLSPPFRTVRWIRESSW